MAPEIGAALLAVGGALAVALIGVWQANLGLRRRSEARTADPFLLRRRWRAYEALWTLTRDFGEVRDPAAIRDLASRMNDWYFPNGLTLSGDAQGQWLRVRNLLAAAGPGSITDDEHREIERELSLLRSWLKADLNFRTIGEVKRAAKAAPAATVDPVNEPLPRPPGPADFS
jgi:hypothetical protein